MTEERLLQQLEAWMVANFLGTPEWRARKTGELHELVLEAVTDAQRDAWEDGFSTAVFTPQAANPYTGGRR